MFGSILGYTLISFSEPLAVIAYLLRAIRLRKVFDAQQLYYENQIKPAKLIAQFKEEKLMKLVVIVLSALAMVYTIVLVMLWFIPDVSLTYLLPSIDTSDFWALRINDLDAGEPMPDVESRFKLGLTISLYVCILGTLAETVVFLVTMH